MHQPTLISIDPEQFDFKGRELQSARATIDSWRTLPLPAQDLPDWNATICFVAKLGPEKGAPVLALLYYGLNVSLHEG